MQKVIQEKFCLQLFAVHTPPLINFCEGVEQDTLILYLDLIVECLLKLLNPTERGEAVKIICSETGDNDTCNGGRYQ